MSDELLTKCPRMVRVLKLIDNWLRDDARQKRIADPDSREGVGTIINEHLLAAFKADPRNADKLHLLPEELR